MKKLFSGTRKLTAIIISVAVLSALCITCLGIGASVNSDPYIIAAKNAKIKVDNTNKLIIGVRKGLSGLDGYIEVGGNGRLVYSVVGEFTKDTKISLYNSNYSQLIGVYSIVFRGDVNRDGTVDSLDVSELADAVKFKTVVSGNSIKAEIMDVNCDGYIDAQDLHIVMAISNGADVAEPSTQKPGGIDEDYWGEM